MGAEKKTGWGHSGALARALGMGLGQMSPPVAMWQLQMSPASTAPRVQLRIVFGDSLNPQPAPARSWLEAPQITALRGPGSPRASSSERSLQQPQLLVVTTKASEHEEVPGASPFTLAPKTAPDSGGVSIPRAELFKHFAFEEQTRKRGRARRLRSSTPEDRPRRFN